MGTILIILLSIHKRFNYGCVWNIQDILLNFTKLYTRKAHLYDKQKCFKYYKIFKHYQYITLSSLANVKTQLPATSLNGIISHLINYSIMRTIAYGISWFTQPLLICIKAIFPIRFTRAIRQFDTEIAKSRTKVYLTFHWTLHSNNIEQITNAALKFWIENAY